MNKIDKFYDVKGLFQCPKCKKKIRFHSGGLVCKREHRFDISAKGYVNLRGVSKPLKGYDQKFFESRACFFEKDYYKHIADAVLGAVCSKTKETSPEETVVVDAGCGEGYYADIIAREFPEMPVLAFDIATDAIKVACKKEGNVRWFVSDITDIPLKDESVDVILDVFTPANYDEFNRILKPNGIVVKVIPGEHHVGELREAARDLIRNKEYSNEEVLDYFDERFERIDSIFATNTMAIDKETLKDLVNMTPLLFDVDKSKLDTSNVNEITIEAEILIGHKK